MWKKYHVLHWEYLGNYNDVLWKSYWALYTFPFLDRMAPVVYFSFGTVHSSWAVIISTDMNLYSI